LTMRFVRCWAIDAVEELATAGAVHNTEKGALLPQLAEAVPSIENGLWKVFPDGRMETTLRLKSNAQWQDGKPVTAADLLLGAALDQDAELGVPRNQLFDYVEGIEASDPSTVVVRWKEPFIEADAMFGFQMALPLPSHILGQPYLEDRANFFGPPFWNEGFVGAGPFRIRSWVTDSHVILQANDGYVLGRPKIDEVEVRFITDPNTMTANLMSGVIELSMGRTLLPVEQAQELFNQRPEMRTADSFRSWYPIHTQFINSNPPIVTDLRFRRAMLQSIDRQQLVDTFSAGRSPIAHSFVPPDLAEYKDVENAIVRYQYDPRSAAEAIGSLGYAKGPDGMFADSAGQKLGVSIWTTTRSEIQPKITLAIADFWKANGVDVETNMVPPQRIADSEYRSQYPAYEMISGGVSVASRDIRRFHSSSTPLPENRFGIGGNNSRYRNPEMDRLIETYLTTVPRAERMEALRQLVRFHTDQIPSMALFYEVDFTVYNNRLTGVTARGPTASQAWNAETWDLKG
jgi:peptide/nickel transport system substrate-binding protein